MSADLAAEAAVLAPLLSGWRRLHAEGALADFDLAGAFILACAAVRAGGRGWALARMKPALLQPEDEAATGSAELAAIPGLVELLEPDRVDRWLPAGPRRVVSAFSNVRLRGIRKHSNDFANTSICAWAQGLRPFVLMFNIPSPMRVLKMQAAGRRVVTMFSGADELACCHHSQLHYMEGDKSHSRDALHFLVHDLAHMEHLQDPITHLEQIGFFRCCLGLEPSTREFFSGLGGDQKLWHQVEYVISDFNAMSNHLLGYLKAKWISACHRIAPDNPHGAAVSGWARLLDGFRMEPGSPAREAAEALCVREEPLSPEEVEALREHFRGCAGDSIELIDQS